MKKLLLFIPLVLILSIRCSTDTAPAFNAELCVIVDLTDTMAYPTAEELVQPLALKEHPYQSVKIVITAISDHELNDVQVLTLNVEQEWTGNLTLRTATVQHFVKQVQQCLDTMHHAKPLPYTIAYRTIARQANRLAASTATRRYMAIYSDLCEHTPEIDFYNPNTIRMLRKNPQGIDQQLEATVPLASLSGIQAFFIYNPASYAQNNSYMPVAEFYQRLFTAHGATTVHIATKLSQP